MHPTTNTIEDTLYEPTTHVQLNFSLLQDGQPKTPSSDQFAQIMSLFPNCTSVKIMLSFLVVTCKTLPPRPWPLSVAGLPLYITTENKEPLDLGLRMTGPKLRLEAEMRLWKTPEKDTFVKIFELFDNLEIAIQRIRWMGWGMLILAAKEPSETSKSKLPSSINDLYVGYMFGEEAVNERALRTKLPTTRDHDDEYYSTLRPGVKVCSQVMTGSDSLCTTSGVCLESPGGKKYITIASHGVENTVGTEVRHPNVGGKLLGQVSKIFGETDIALCQLEPGITYSKETFSTVEDTVEPFRSLVHDSASLQIMSLVFMDTPYNGRCEGQITAVEWRRIPSDDIFAKSTKYALGTFAYFGNGSEEMFEGCCGGVLWTSEYDVIGQFRYQAATNNGFCFFPAFEFLAEFQYKLSEVVPLNPERY